MTAIQRSTTWPPASQMSLGHAATETVPAIRENDPLLTLQQIIPITQWSAPSIYRAIAKGEFPPSDTRLGRRVFWYQSTIELYLADRAALEAQNRKPDRPIWQPKAVMRAPDGEIVPIPTQIQE